MSIQTFQTEGFSYSYFSLIVTHVHIVLCLIFPSTTQSPTSFSSSAHLHHSVSQVHVYPLHYIIGLPLIQPHEVLPTLLPMVNPMWLISTHLEHLSH